MQLVPSLLSLQPLVTSILCFYEPAYFRYFVEHEAELHSLWWPNGIPLHIRIMFGSSVHLLMGTGSFHPLAVGNKAAVNMSHACICLSPCSLSFGYMPISGISGPYDNSVFHFLRNHETITLYLFPFGKGIISFSPQLWRWPDALLELCFGFICISGSVSYV